MTTRRWRARVVGAASQRVMSGMRPTAWRRWRALLVGAALWATGVSATPLPRAIEFVTRGHDIPSAAYSLYVREVGKQTPALAINPDRAFNPASVVKILPTLAALELLGPAYRWKTEVYLLGEVVDGVLHGDILFKGYGDPHLVTEDFRRIPEELRRRGITAITGDMVIDDSYFSVPDADPGAFDDKPHRTYNVLPNALLVNYKAVQFHFYPAADGRRVVVQPEPALAGLQLDNRLRLRRSSCRGFQRGIAVRIDDAENADRVTFSGTFPTGCRHYTLPRAALTHHTYAFGMFASVWRQLGGSIAGGVRRGRAPATQAPFLTHHSKPLSDVVKLINKFSNNVMSRQLLLTLGAELQDAPGTPDKGIAVIEQYLTDRGIDTRTLKLDNGAGLSREARASAKLLADVLDYAMRLRYRWEFVASLAIPGVDGTAKNRLKYKQAAGFAHVKTGTINDVSAIAGYVQARSGRLYVVSGLLNHQAANKGPGKELMNALIIWTRRQ